MVAHWRRQKSGRVRTGMFLNGLGALATGITVLVVIAAKFTEGAWITLALIPLLLFVMSGTLRHYRRISQQIAVQGPLPVDGLQPPLVVVPIEEWNRVSRNALHFALTLSRDVQAVHVECGEKTETLKKQWDEWVKTPAIGSGIPAPALAIVKSPYRFVLAPILNYVLDLERKNKDRNVAVVLPQLVEARWYYFLLHNQRSQTLAALLMLCGDRRIAVVSVPWYLNE
jgi:hypothetical protein